MKKSIKSSAGVQVRQSTLHDKRLNQILDVAVRIIGQNGFYGTSLQQISDAVGMTNAGVLHYVNSKSGLMTMLLEREYDKPNPSWVELQKLERMRTTSGDVEAVTVPQFYRITAKLNESRPSLVRLFSMLNTEALQEGHPAHGYFERRERKLWEEFSRIKWSLPQGVDPHKVFLTANSAMDGIQIRWLRDDAVSLVEMWQECEDVIFPLPKWDCYR